MTSSGRFKNLFTTLIFEDSMKEENLLGPYQKIFRKFTLLPCPGSFALELKNSISPYRIRPLNLSSSPNLKCNNLKERYTYKTNWLN